MALIDSIIGAESGGNPNAHSPAVPSIDVLQELFALSLIGKLLFTRRPSAILWRVISIHVNAVNRVIGRRLYSHISEKIREAIAPTLANFNAPRSVVFVRDVFGVFAPRNHCKPSSVLRGSWLAATYAARGSVSRIDRNSSFNLVTAAAFRVAGLEVWNGSQCRLPAIAQALHAPDRRPRSVLPKFRFCLRNGNQLPKSHSYVILAGHK